LTSVSASLVTVTEALGPVLRLHRLARGATGFFEVSGDHWSRLAEDATIPTGGTACVETLMAAGGTLLALRVFLGATCGPA
jgi:hypothetical protein